MRRRYLAILILMLPLVFGTMLIGSCAKQIIKDVTVDEAFNLIQENKNNSDFVILDVRTPQEFSDGHIEGAINMDYNSGVFSDDIKKLDRDKTYLVYCRTGNRSRGAINEMTELGFREIYHLYVGIVSWSDAGYTIVK